MMKSLEQILTEKHHVIVQLYKETFSDVMCHKVIQTPFKTDNSEPFVGQDYNALLINHNNINNKNQLKLYFDCVCYGFDGTTRYEINLMMDQLFLGQQNCCMIRCSVYKENCTALLNYILLKEINKHLQKNHFVMSQMNCEYYDIRKLNIVNMFGNQSNIKRFQSPIDLQKWLNDEYPQLSIGCQGNECLNFEFVYYDRINRKFTVKFSYMHITLSKLDLDSKTALANCLLNVNKHYALGGYNSPLVDTIRDFLGNKNHMRIWLFLSLIIKTPKTDLMEDMIKIACAASEGFSLQNTKIPNQNNPNDIKRLNITTECDVVNKLQNLQQQQQQEQEQQEQQHDIEKSKDEIKVETDIDISIKSLPEYKNHIHLWYNRINEQYNHVTRAMETYYDKKYEMHMQQFSINIHDIVNHDEIGLSPLEEIPCQPDMSVSILETLPQQDDLNQTVSEWSMQLLSNLLMDYRDAATDFTLMADEINKTNYESLKAYMHTKSDALKHSLLEYKLKKLRDMQNELQQTIKKESKIILKNLQQNL